MKQFLSTLFMLSVFLPQRNKPLKLIGISQQHKQMLLLLLKLETRLSGRGPINLLMMLLPLQEKQMRRQILEVKLLLVLGKPTNILLL